MNTIGKILVVLNFVFAVVVGGFLVVDFATRSNWKAEYDNLKRQTEVINADRQTYADMGKDREGKYKEMQLEVEKLKGDLADQEATQKVKLQELEVQLKEAQDKAKDADLNLTKALSDVERLKTSEADLKSLVQQREKAILSLQDDVKKFRTEALANEQLANSLKDRNQQLLEQNQNLGKQLRDALLASTGNAPGAPAPAPGAPGNFNTPPVNKVDQPNPPTTQVKARVEKVDSAGWVQISAGSDQGIAKNNTMEVFRRTPEAKYLGMVRIVDVYPHRAVGRLIVPPGTTTRPQIREGDDVWSWLSR